jgi:outer membrane protein OmpA-like peptidoglycan-associated protein
MTPEKTRFRILVSAFAIAINCLPFRLSAQEGISIETFKISSSSNSMFETPLPEVKKHLDWSVGLLLSVADEPVFHKVRMESGALQTGYPIWFRNQLDIYASLGLFKVLEVGLIVPLVLYQKSEDPINGTDVQHSGILDPRIELKGRFLNRPHLEMGLGASVTFPVGHFASSGRDYMGSALPTFEPKLLIASPVGPVILAGDIGFLVRKTATIGDQTQTHALTWNAGIAWDVVDFKDPDGFRVMFEASGEMDVAVDYTSTPVETLVGFKYRGHRDMVFSIGAGPGISRGLGTPTFRALAGIAYDPITRITECTAGPEDIDGFQDDDRCVDPDNDNDGYPDISDKCPEEVEDKDGFQDNDGCPDLDNDLDSIPDGVDSCPLVPEDNDNFEDEDGCPEEGPGKTMVRITDTQLLVSSKIYFDYDKAVIKPISYPILDAVADTMLANHYIEKIRVEGHTDNEGTEDYNLQLSEKRARAVMEYLIGKNVPKERLDYRGYGFSRPKASNDSEAGKAINRRVEFTIVRGE